MCRQLFKFIIAILIYSPAFICHSVAAAIDSNLPLLMARSTKISKTIKSPRPIIELDGMTDQQRQVYQLILTNKDFTKFLLSKDNTPHLNEVFGIYPAKPGDLKDSSSVEGVFKIEMYNFALNMATVGLVDLKSKQVEQITHYPDSQPDIPLSLKKLAIELATNAPEVIAALGGQPKEKEALMASTKTSLNRTRCERSRHLCVAPTFVKKDKALWTIVDLTDLNIVGIRWTNVGETGPAIVTERKLQDDYITQNFCDQIHTVSQDGWKLDYHITSSDGLEIRNVSYKGKPVLNSAKLVDWHVRYSNTDGFGYSDAIGCPVFSQAAVVANKPPTITKIDESSGSELSDSGFVLEQSYFNQDWPKPCNYNYRQKYEFYANGRFRISAASIGRGCGNDGTYTPVFRIAFSNTKKISSFTDNTWKTIDKEQWILQSSDTSYFQDRFQFKIDTANGSYFLEPSKGQFSDGGRGDFAYTYITKEKPDEGENNLITLGPCCNTDYRQGPEKFIEPTPENLLNKEFVLWYAPQLKNDDRIGHEYCWAESLLIGGKYQAKVYPCYAGPMFVPMSIPVAK